MEPKRWTTIDCCNDGQLIRLAWIGTYSVLMVYMWRWPWLYPTKIFAYFAHEAFRYGAAKLTCGQVEAIDIHPEEGSETSFHGGVPVLVHVAGYVGSLCLGCVFIVCSALTIPRLVCGSVVVVLLFAFTCCSNTRYLRSINALSLTVAVSAAVASYVIHRPEIIEGGVLFSGITHALLFLVDASSNSSRVHPRYFPSIRLS
ncbi:hypothetical protein, variant [Aphanomyces astaci]|uniref:Uncharacterized protein n=1 Tax=Aphanomyces astaci TaxID=112090 RepID=W4FYF3_APHAT|nr:hypothetical protein, variant [Aphanomyces astaci]ETV72520.1 hypothetical protein, variant [Aphanomyces astaci]|eukprot:XP_009838202.1 hypothetical protein, variant [Aphanomyces astaci]